MPAAHAPLSRSLAAIYGALFGDALGVPFEFKLAEQIPAIHHIDLVMPQGYPKTHGRAAYGTWSDDGSQLLCLLETLMEGRGQLDLAAFAGRLLAWHDNGLHQAGGLVFDVGGQTRRALELLRRGVHAEQAGGFTAVHDRNDAHGNGALMRTLPAALAPFLWPLPAEEALRLSMRQCLPTHGQPLSQATCALYAALVQRVGATPAAPVGARLPWRSWAQEEARLLAQLPMMQGPAYQAALADLTAFEKTAMPNNDGYVVNTFWSAIWALERAANYLEAVKLSITLGNDTDTAACITGGLAGLAWGLSSVPTRWWAQITLPAESKRLLEQLEDGLNLA